MIGLSFFGVLFAALIVSQPATAPENPQATVSFTGHVVTPSGTDTRPVRRAKVTLTGGTGTTRVTHTDTSGVYRFDRLTAGDYRVRVEKPGFVTLETGAADDSTLNLQRGGAIEGMVADAAGDPAWNVIVRALQLLADGKPKAVAQARTDDQGRYRLHSLAAGDYYIEATIDERVLGELQAMLLDARARSRFHPAANAIEDARSLRVVPGRDTTSVDITFARSASPVVYPVGAARGGSGAAGASSIAGQVVDASSGRPIRNAGAVLMPLDGPRSASLVKTNAEGRFAFSTINAGRYSITVSAERFVTLEFGQKRPGEAGMPIVVHDGENLTADFKLPHVSAIEGIVLDEFGDPAPNVTVRAARKQYAAGRQRLMPVRSRPQPAPTDDQGHYRISALPPGDYYVAALTGPYSDIDDPGGFAPTYYPGTSDSGSAAPLTITPGVDSVAPFSLVPAKTVRVSGTMVDEAGQPAWGRLWLTPPDSLQHLDFNLATSDTASDGSFLIEHVVAGSYTMQGFGAHRDDSRPVAILGEFLFGWLPITVGDSDLENVILRVKRGMSLRGQIVVDDTSISPPAPEQVRVTAFPVEFDSAPVSQIAVAGVPIDFGAGPIDANPPLSRTFGDLTFEVVRLSGMRRIFVDILSPDWSLEKITRNEIDITETAQDFRTKDVEGVEIVLTSKVSRIRGAVSDDKGSVSDYAVVFFSADPTKWIDRSRFVKMARPAQDGRFEVRGLPPQDYLVIALPSIVGSEWQDPEFLHQLRSQATALVLTEGESRTLELKLMKRP
jgi:protocatechuate 3,4-dioxygenase beta subunit